MDITLPQAGTLLFFYFDGQYGNRETTVGFWEPATLAGARVLHVGPGETASPRACPAGINPYQRVEVGGYAAPVQGPVEYEVVIAALGGGIRGDDPHVRAEQARWTLLAQIDSDDRAGMMWGDCGALYWLSRREEMTDSHLAPTSFTWQCA